jgi:hypothetical protein
MFKHNLINIAALIDANRPIGLAEHAVSQRSD